MKTRQSSDPRSEKYNFFVSDRIQVTADPKSSFAGEKLLSGDYLRAALSPDLSDLYTKEVPSSDGTTTTLKYYVSKEELIQGFDYVKSVRAEYVDSEKPNPLNNSSVGSGELAGSVYLHSGEFELDAVDLRLPGRGFDFELRRTSQSQSIYSGPLGWNWDHSYNRRLLELPDGSLAYFDGAGRRETFPAERNEAGIILKYKIPAGYFLEVYRRADGSTTLRDGQGGIMIFNALGRLVKLMDRNANYMEFSYDLSGKLSLAIDTMGRLIRFDYYPYAEGDPRSNRLKEVVDFSGRKVVYSYDERGDLEAADFEGRITRYAYTEGADLDAEHNLRSVTDPNGQTAVEVSYDGEDKVIGQKKGGVSISVSSGQSALTTDGRGVARLYTHDDKGHPVSVTEGGFATSYSYNQDGLITRITYPLGNSVEYSYDSGNAERRSQSNLLSELRIPDGRGGEPLQTIYTYDPSSNAVKSIVDPKGNRIEFTLDDRGKVIASHYPENAAYLFEYNGFGQKVKETLPNGSITTYEYYPESSPSGGASPVIGRDVDPSTGGYLKEVVRDSAGDKLASHFIYDARGNVTEETSEQGVKATYSIDDYDQATSRTVVGTVGQGAAPIQAIFSYDQNGNLVMHSEQNITTTYTYNNRNLMETMTRTAGDVTQAFNFGYDESGNRTSISYPKGNGDEFVYNNRNLLQTKTEGGLTTTSYGYDGNGNLTSVTDGAGKTTTYAFDGLDRPAFTADPLGNKIEYTRDRNSNVTRIAGKGADGAQTVVQNSYDGLDRMTTRQVGTSVSRYGYNASSHLVSVENPNNRAWSFGRSGTGLLKQSDDPAGNSDAMGYTAGTLTSVSEREAGGKTLDRSMMRDGFGSVVKEADSAGREQRYIYNVNQRLESTGDAEGGAVSFERDGLGRVTKEIRHLTYGAETRQYETIYRYDPNGNLASVTDAKGNATSYEYDAKDRLTKIVYADSSAESFVYDGNDRLSVYTDQNGTVVTNTYDDAGRLVKRDIAKAAGVAGSSFEAFDYDGLGRIIRAENDVSVVEYSYDDQGRVTNEKQNGKDVGSAYDANGNKTTLTYPSGKVVNYEYDALDRIAFIRSEARQIAAYGYEGKGKVIAKTVGDALKMDAMFDQGRRPAALSFKNVASNKTIVDQAMGWNRVDLKTFEKKQDENGKGNRYAYDSLYRLRQVKENMADPENAGGAGEKETSYDIDGVENVVARVDKEKGVDNTAIFTVDNRNRITSYKGDALSYDANGNLQGFRGDQYIYDWKNQLVQVNTANGNVVVMSYDALGRRIGKSVSGSQASNLRYVYDGWRVIEERDGSDIVKARYSHGNGIDELVEIEKAAAVPGQYNRYYPAQGTNGSVLAVTDSNGEIAEKVNYSAYGKPVFVYDHAGPEVDVIRVETGNIFIRFSEAVKRDKVQSALKVKIGTEVVSGAVSFEDKDRLAKFAPSSALINGELSVEVGEGLEDLAGNKIAAAVTKSVNYTGTDVMVFDRTSPSVESVKIVGNAVLVEFNEEIKAESVAGGIELKRGTNVAAGNTVLENLTTVKFTATGMITPSVEYVITVKTSIQDLSGKALSAAKTVTFTYSGSDEVLFSKPDPDQQSKSYIGNPYLFQGREFDAETNLYYFRARYMHPELGRFLQPDPVGYQDSLNLFQSFGNNPVNFMDPNGERLFIKADSEQQLTAIKNWLYSILGRNNGSISFNERLSQNDNNSYPLTFSPENMPSWNDPLVGSYEVTLSEFQNTDDIGANLLKNIISSNKNYFLGVGNYYPTKSNLLTPATHGNASGNVGLEENLDPNPDWRFQISNPNASKPDDKLPPIGIDSVVWFHPDFLNGPNNMEYYDSVGEGHPSLGTLEALYFIVFHEMSEAYYKIERGFQYRERNNLNVGAHPSANIDEERWRRQLYRIDNTINTNVVGGVVRLKSPNRR